VSASFSVTRDASEPDHPLARAFASFTEAAGSLERTYSLLQGQVVHLRKELEVTNRSLAASLEENARIRERLRRILEGLPCGVVALEGGDRTSVLNPEGARLLGLSDPHETLGPEISHALRLSFESGAEQEVSLAAARGAQPRWIAIRHAWLDEEHGDSVFIVRDISEAKKVEAEREQFRRQQALVEMSALLAHEIRNPLGSLELFTGLLAEAGLEGERQHWVEHVQAGLRTLSSTVNNVLHLHNAPPAECAEMDMGELLDWAYDFLLPLTRQSRVELHVINGLRGVRMHADRHRLEQVLLNLALNACRFMPGGGWLSIAGQDLEQGGVTIEVRDTGPGIASDDLPRIFEAGFSTRPGSSGLGLAVCHKILEQHGGSITAESRPGYGAKFHLHIPAAGEQP
jgi:signal transduction histidine kinase